MSEEIRIVVPTYNEKDNIEILIPRLFEVSERNDLDVDVLIVDDNSPDNTARFAEKMGEKYSIKVIKRSKKSGLGTAYIRGFKESLKDGKDIIFEMDADLSHNPEYIPDFVEKIKSGFDVVIGERKEVEGWGLYRKTISWGGNFIGKIIAGVSFNDLTTGYRAYRDEVLKGIDLDEIESNGYAFQLEMLAKSMNKNLSIGSVPIVFYDRKMGNSKLSKWDIVEFFKVAFKIRFSSLIK
ncbi:MAG: polyprenol monophosphomannose synthase [Candidatus Aenigmatarchaeota archaeon]